MLPHRGEPEVASSMAILIRQAPDLRDSTRHLLECLLMVLQIIYLCKRLCGIR